jgi:pyrroloquinoline quinone biosynthesis protein B
MNYLMILILLMATNSDAQGFIDTKQNNVTGVTLVVLGISQDAGYPQLSCYQTHCLPAWKDKDLRKTATSLALVDFDNKQKFLFEATPDIRQQMYQLHLFADDDVFKLAGVFISHAHIGHYTGLMHFGREAAATEEIKVYVMPRMKQFLTNNGPWSQLVTLKNIVLNTLSANKIVKLNNNIRVQPFLVPHRDEFSETVGYRIYGPNKTALFIPDINKWDKWQANIVEEIQKVDYAIVDATFYQNGEIANRDMSEIPHPFVSESLKLFQPLSKNDRNKVIFIHFNHSNPLLQKDSKAQQHVLNEGYNIAKEGMQITL